MTVEESRQSGLVIEKLCVTYGTVPALRELSLRIEPGEHLVIVGPSGSGKSTLLRCIAGLLMPDHGTIHWNGATWTNAASHELLAPEKRRIGLMTQHPALWPHLNASDHLMLTLKWRGVKRSSRRQEARRLLDLVSLSHRADHRPSELSGGEAQRLALARALCGRPPLLLLDEPLGQLDLLLRADLARRIQAAARDIGATVLHVTHDPADIAGATDRIGVIENGMLVQVATKEELAASPLTPFAAAVVRHAST